MEKINLQAKTRSILGKKVKQLRSNGFIPVALYGQGKGAENISVLAKDFRKAYKKAGKSALVDLKIEEKNPIKIIIKDVQRHVVSEDILHADFYKIKMDEEITANIPLVFIGEAPAVKELEGNLITNKDEVEVECLPGDLIHEIQVDISGLHTFDDAILIKDLVVPANVKILDEPEETVVLVTPPRSEEELEAMETEAVADSEKAQIEKMEAEAEAEKVTEGEEKSEKSDDNKKDEK
ncbi:MAG: hypothetical protein ACD_58C00010G0003 [uncultured bacterium]|nr:MAG: hypothetical protein ACD_58C00010G0003 [uncultured bacterium]